MTRARLIRIIIERALFNLLIALIVAFFVFSPIMLSLGALHSEWPVIPALGWGDTYIITVAWILVWDSTKSPSSGSSNKES